MKCKECRTRKTHARGLCGRCYQRWYIGLHPDWHKTTWQRLKQVPEKELLKAARRRARKRNRPFGITLKDINIPESCPILGTKLFHSRDYPTEQSPSLDEVVVGRGYVVGNIQVISRKANTMKSNATPDELRKFAKWIRSVYGD